MFLGILGCSFCGLSPDSKLHYDSLGSVDTITNQRGEVVQRMAYKPFGEQIEVTKTEDTITNRGYTGHEHIEGTKLIHMNARIYDPTIGRFLSADTIIQDPYDTQAYNRYSYVKNNPLKYTDPSGHFWGIGSWIKRHWGQVREYLKYGLIFGNKWVQNYVATHKWAQIAGGIVSGAVGGPLGAAWWSAYSADVQGGNLTDIAGAGITAYVSAGLANGIGDAFGHNSSFLNIGGETTIAGEATQITTSMALKKAILHGIVRGMVHAGQGGKFGSGFASGFVSSGISVGNKGFGKGATGVMTRTAIMAGVGGTTSWITGGKFANGAQSGAFIYMFNELGSMYIDKNNHLTSATGLDPDLPENIFDMGAGIGGGIHLGLVGINAHYDFINGTCNVCARVGPGAYIGGGVEGYGYATYGETSSEWYGTSGFGADIMFGNIGESGGINGNFDTVAVTGGTKYGLGLGGSVGLDFCVNW